MIIRAARLRLICWAIGHRWRFQGYALEGNKLWECRRCGVVKTGAWVPKDQRS